jgi:hypothetical protein
VKAWLVRVWGWAAAHPVLFVFLVALTARVALALGVFLAHDGALFSDDLLFQRLAREMADGNTAHWSDSDRSIFYATSTFLWPLTLAARLGSPVLAGQLMVAVVGAGAAALTTVVGLRAVRVAWAIAAGLVMALLPSMVLWSSLTLKDAFVWCVLAGIGVVACELDGPPARFAMVGGAGVVLLVLMDHLRAQTFVVAVWAFAAALVLGGGRLWRVRGAVGVLVLLALPALLGYGVMASSWINDSIHGSVERREGNTIGAESALSCAKTANDIDGVVRHLPCGLPAALLRPYPWESGGSLGLNLARLEALAWYPLLALSLYGLTRAWPSRQALAFPVLASVGSLLVYASVEGNLGTAFRHRAEVVWGVALLAAVGAQTIADRRRLADSTTEAPVPADTLAR